MNILAIRELIEDDRRLMVWEIAAHVEISYESSQSIISNHLGYKKRVGKVGSSPVDGRSERKPSCRVRKTRHDIEQREVIS